jgi:hypothetical protein
MFAVRITADAMHIVERMLAKVDGPKPGLMIHRQGPLGENSRTESGDVGWEIQRRHQWAARADSYETIADDDENLVIVDGVRVWLPLIPRPGEKGVVVCAREGELHVEAIEG